MTKPPVPSTGGSVFSTVTAKSDLTLARYGYSFDSLSAGSHSKIIVECDSCHTLLVREKRYVGKKHQCPVQDGDQRRCFRCQKWKDLSFFSKSGKDGKLSKMCKECFNAHPAVQRYEKKRQVELRNAFHNDPTRYFKTRLSSIASHCKRDSIPFDITYDFAISLWQQQDGKCFYSGIPMARTMNQDGFQCWDAPSLDRKQPSQGYVRENVVWCCFGVNSFKQTLTDQQFADVIERINWWFSGSGK